MEWSNPYNPFNSVKALAWRQEFEQLAMGSIPRPVAITIDPTNVCNLGCEWCKYEFWTKDHPATVKGDRLASLAIMLSDWGVKAACIAGGGEPTLHPDLPELIRLLHVGGLKVSMITNGTRIDPNIIEVAGCLSWVGVSVDAGTEETWMKWKRPKTSATFYDVLRGIQSLTKGGVKVGFKYLIHPGNISEIVDAVHLARELDCSYFHARPAYFESARFSERDARLAWEAVNEARTYFEDNRFQVMGVSHKFTPDMRANIPFKRCRVTSLGGTVFAADGGTWLCCDNRGREGFRLCGWEETRKLWGSLRHHDMQEAIDVSKCGRCTYREYGVILEEVFEKDSMNYHFI